jgi:hypothetical protein
MNVDGKLGASAKMRRKRANRGGSALLDCIGTILLIGVAAFLVLKTDFGRHLFDAGRQITDSQRLLGKWKQQDGPLNLTFFADHTLREERLLDAGKGTYRLLPNRRIELKIDGVLWGQNEVTLQYDISEGELVLTPDAGSGIALRYRKLY